MYLPSITPTIHFVFFFVPFASALLMTVVRSSSVSNAKRAFSDFSIARLHVTSWRPCWWSINNSLSLRWELNLIFMQILRKKKLYCIDHQHGRLVTLVKLKNLWGRRFRWVRNAFLLFLDSFHTTYYFFISCIVANISYIVVSNKVAKNIKIKIWENFRWVYFTGHIP